MIQYKKLIIKRDNQIIGYLYFQQGATPTIQDIRTYLHNYNLSSYFSDQQLQDIIDSQYIDIDGDLCCTDLPPLAPVIEYTVEDNNTIYFSINNYIISQDYIINIYNMEAPNVLLDSIEYTEPIGIDLDAGMYKFVIITSTCAGTVTREFNIEFGNISIVINIFGNLQSSNIQSPDTTITIPTFVGDSVDINANVIDQINNLWRINSITANGMETINNEVFDIAKVFTNGVITEVNFTASNIQQSLTINILSTYNTVEWCDQEECFECVFDQFPCVPVTNAWTDEPNPTGIVRNSGNLDAIFPANTYTIVWQTPVAATILIVDNISGFVYNTTNVNPGSGSYTVVKPNGAAGVRYIPVSSSVTGFDLRIETTC